jgi:hypothetical protein
MVLGLRLAIIWVIRNPEKLRPWTAAFDAGLPGAGS